MKLKAEGFLYFKNGNKAMSKTVKRGSSPGDTRDFSGTALKTLKRAARDLYFLLGRGYSPPGAVTFVGNHYLLTDRQRTALRRVVSSKEEIAARIKKQKHLADIAGETVHIDGFNEIITLEVALSASPVFRCMDGTFRDLAGLRGTYRLIDKTDIALRKVIGALQKLCAGRAVFWLDAPVSNSGRLKMRIAEIAEEKRFDAGIEVVRNVDRALYSRSNVISSDSVILGRCLSWLNLNEELIAGLPGSWVIDLWKNA